MLGNHLGFLSEAFTPLYEKRWGTIRSVLEQLMVFMDVRRETFNLEKYLNGDKLREEN